MLSVALEDAKLALLLGDGVIEGSLSEVFVSDGVVLAEMRLVACTAAVVGTSAVAATAGTSLKNCVG